MPILRNTHLRALALATLVALTVPAHAQQTDESVKITPSTLIMLDGGAFASGEKNVLRSGVAVADARLGVRASFGKWTARVDLSMAYGKLQMRDVFVQYNFNAHNRVRVGYFVDMYGLLSATSVFMRPTMEDPMPNAVFANPHQIGAMYVHSADSWLTAATLHTEPNAQIFTPSQLGGESLGVLTRSIWRPMAGSGRIAQIGLSLGYSSAQTAAADSKYSGFTLQGNFPTRVDRAQAVGVSIASADYMWKLSPELLISQGRWAFESQYYFNHIAMGHGLRGFNGWGLYGTLRYMIKGGDYPYDMGQGTIPMLPAGSLEAVLNYNYTDLCDRKAQQVIVPADDSFKPFVVNGVNGGRAQVVSGTVNWYVHRFVTLRANCAWVHRSQAPSRKRVDMFMLQGRVMVLF